MNKTWGTWGQHLSKILNLYLGLGFWYLDTGLVCFHPLQALVVHRNLLSATVVVYLTLVTFLNYLKIHSGWILRLFGSCSLCCLLDLNSKHWASHGHENFGWGGILKRLNFSLDFLLVQKTNSFIHLVKTLWSVAWLDEFTFWKVENWRGLLASEHVAGK